MGNVLRNKAGIRLHHQILAARQHQRGRGDGPELLAAEDVVQSFQGPIKSQEKALQMDIRPLLSFHGDEKAIRQLVSIWYNGNETKSPVPSKGALLYRVNPVCALCETNRPDIQVSGLFCITPFRTRECLPCAALQHLSALCGGNNVSRGGTALLDFAGCVRPRQGVPALLLNLTRSAGACFFSAVWGTCFFLSSRHFSTCFWGCPGAGSGG